jgi:hypothetical protein
MTSGRRLSWLFDPGFRNNVVKHFYYNCINRDRGSVMRSMFIMAHYSTLFEAFSFAG